MLSQQTLNILYLKHFNHKKNLISVNFYIKKEVTRDTPILMQFK